MGFRGLLKLFAREVVFLSGIFLNNYHCARGRGFSERVAGSFESVEMNNLNLAFFQIFESFNHGSYNENWSYEWTVNLLISSINSNGKLRSEVSHSFSNVKRILI